MFTAALKFGFCLKVEKHGVPADVEIWLLTSFPVYVVRTDEKEYGIGLKAPACRIPVAL
jgi:hypothetical protein